MFESRSVTIRTGGKKVVLAVEMILYVLMVGKNAEIHVSGGEIYKTRLTMSELETMLRDGFIKAHRGCLVSVMAIHSITDAINLNNGDRILYTIRKKNKMIEQFQDEQKKLIAGFAKEGIPATQAEYNKHYASFDSLTFAFTDIEMVYDEKRRAVDWIFRYGNSALAALEKLPLEKLIGNTFGTLFRNMDVKWLQAYERATLYGETLEIMDYSPEIDTFLKIICFPTFKGHCGCILFDVSKISFSKLSADTERTLSLYYGAHPRNGR